jgi:putative flippase GtrA
MTNRIFRFAITGIFVTLVHIVVATLWILWVNHEPSLANAIAFIVATLFSFVINTFWSFSSAISTLILMKYVTVALVGLFLSAGVAWAVDQMGFSYPYGIAAVVCVIPPVNFAMHHFWTYRIRDQFEF